MVEELRQSEKLFLEGLQNVQDQIKVGKDVDVVVTCLNLLGGYLASLKEQGANLTAEQTITKTLVEALAQINLSPLSKEEWLNFNEYLMSLNKTILQAALAEVKKEKSEA